VPPNIRISRFSPPLFQLNSQARRGLLAAGRRRSLQERPLDAGPARQRTVAISESRRSRARPGEEPAAGWDPALCPHPVAHVAPEVGPAPRSLAPWCSRRQQQTFPGLQQLMPQHESPPRAASGKPFRKGASKHRATIPAATERVPRPARQSNTKFAELSPIGIKILQLSTHG
jgi:hypothetical protein